MIDLIRGKACDTLLVIRTAQLKAAGEENMMLGGVRIDLEKKIDVYEDTIIPAWVGKEKEWVAKEIIYKGEVRKYKRRWIITGAVAVVVIGLETVALVNSLK